MGRGMGRERLSPICTEEESGEMIEEEGLRLGSESWSLGPVRPRCPCPALRAATPGSLLVEGVTPLGKGGSGGPAFHPRGSPVSDSQLPDTLRWRGLMDFRV